jgi:hypothetical protein
MSAEEQAKAQVDELTQQTENIVLGWVVEDISPSLNTPPWYWFES